MFNKKLIARLTFHEWWCDTCRETHDAQYHQLRRDIDAIARHIGVNLKADDKRWLVNAEALKESLLPPEA